MMDWIPFRFLVCWGIALLWPLGGAFMLGNPLAAGQEDKDHYDLQWLEKDVRYLITDEERDVFQGLLTSAERERFIEQFWFRRDPDPRTPINEFREEHYRRIAYANERFQSGIEGWKTDRGRIYILHGPPDESESYPSGGRYFRGPLEGGGASSSYPFERWRYRHIPGLGSNIELEFVDATWAGEYRLAGGPNEKDALMRVPQAGLNRAERSGLARKMDRPFFQPGMRDILRWNAESAGDSPFARYEEASRLMSPPRIADGGVRERVQVDLSYDRLDYYRVRSDQFALGQGKALVAITLQLDNQDFHFVADGNSYAARLVIYGRVTDIGDRLIEEFEEEVILAYPAGAGPEALASRSLYQRSLVLQQGRRYRLDLVIKDSSSGRIGAVPVGIHVNDFGGQALVSSSLVLSDMIVPLTKTPAQDSMFVIGDVKVRPSVDNRFLVGNPLGLYLQLYNLGIDAVDQSPWLETKYSIHRDGRMVLESSGGAQQGVRIYPDGRAVLVKNLRVAPLKPGSYRLDVVVIDRIKREQLELQQDFVLVESSAARGPTNN